MHKTPKNVNNKLSLPDMNQLSTEKLLITLLSKLPFHGKCIWTHSGVAYKGETSPWSPSVSSQGD